MEASSSIVSHRQSQLQRLLYGWIVLILGVRAIQGLLLGQLMDAPFHHVGANNAFWLYWLSGVPTWLQGQPWAAWGLDGLLLGAAMVGVGRPSARWVAGLVTVLLLHYYFYYNSVATHHEHTLLGIVFCVPLLWCRRMDRFVLCFVGLRYYVLWVMASAALWKWCQGSWWVPHQMAEILKQQHLSYLVQHPDARYAQGIRWLIEHPALTNGLWYAGSLLEISFVAGFFTRRWDRYLGALFIGFFVADYALLGINFWEFCIFAIVFCPWNAFWTHYDQKIATTSISHT